MSATMKPSSPRSDGAEVRVLGRERVVGDLGLRAADPRQQGRLAGVRQADQADVGDDLQLQVDRPLLAGLAGLGLPGGAVGRRLEVLVAVPALAAAGDDDVVADAPSGRAGRGRGRGRGRWCRPARRCRCSRRSGRRGCCPGRAGRGRPGSGAWPERWARFVRPSTARTMTWPPWPPSPPFGPPAGDVLLASEAQAAVAAVAALDEQRDPIDEHRMPIPRKRTKPGAGRPGRRASSIVASGPEPTGDRLRVRRGACRPRRARVYRGPVARRRRPRPG